MAFEDGSWRALWLCLALLDHLLWRKPTASIGGHLSSLGVSPRSKLRPSANSWHQIPSQSSEPAWKWIFQPKSSLQMTEASWETLSQSATSGQKNLHKDVNAFCCFKPLSLRYFLTHHVITTADTMLTWFGIGRKDGYRFRLFQAMA